MGIKRALILGGASCVFDDVSKAISLCEYDEYIAINDIGMEFDFINHWCSMHPDKLIKWLGIRLERGYPHPILWTGHDKPIPHGYDFQRVKNKRGGSGLLAIEIARELGCKKIVLTGVPMEASLSHYHTPGSWTECRLYRKIWERNESLKGMDDIRSLSGWTLEQYGKPTKRWLNS